MLPENSCNFAPMTAFRIWIGIAALLLLQLGCTDTTQAHKPLPPPSPADNITMESYNTEYMYSDDAALMAKLYAKHVIERNEAKEKDSPPNVVQYFEDSVHIITFGRTGVVESMISAQRGKYRTTDGVAELRGNVVVTNNKAERLETEVLFWDRKKDSIYNNEYVRVHTADKIISGTQGIRSDGRFNRYQIRGVSGVLMVNEAEK